jgi:hypothetical protein
MSEFDKKISALTSGTDSTATDEYVIARGGSNFKISGALVAAAATKVGTLESLAVTGNVSLGADVVLSRGAADRLDLASGDSLNIVSGTVKIAGTDVLSNNTLGSGVTASSLTSVGTLSALTVTGAATAGKLVPTANTVTGNGMYLPTTNTLAFSTNGVEAARIDASGNVGIGVTPKTYSLGTAIEYGQRGGIAFFPSIGDFTQLSNNVYYNSGFKYKVAAAAGVLNLGSDGSFTFSNAASGTADNTITFTERMLITANGNLLLGKTVDDTNTAGINLLGSSALIAVTRASAEGLIVGRNTTDGTLVLFRQDAADEGSISVSGNTVSYNAFAGSHWSQLEDGNKPEILRGTVIEAIDELCEWPGEQNERLPKCKVSDTTASKKVYGVFMAWDNDWTETNDMYVTALGAFVCRISADVTVEQGDLLESNGDGTARVQADDVIRSSTIGKVTSTVQTHQYEDGTYCVPVVLYCG